MSRYVVDMNQIHTKTSQIWQKLNIFTRTRHRSYIIGSSQGCRSWRSPQTQSPMPGEGTPIGRRTTTGAGGCKEIDSTGSQYRQLFVWLLPGGWHTRVLRSARGRSIGGPGWGSWRRGRRWRWRAWRQGRGGRVLQSVLHRFHHRPCWGCCSHVPRLPWIPK